MNDDLWWSDKVDVNGKVLKMSRQCHITLIDFGFTRALNPDDIDAVVGLKKVTDESLLSTSTQNSNEKDGEILGYCMIDQVLEDTSPKQLGSHKRGHSNYVDDSVSHTIVLDLSEYFDCSIVINNVTLHTFSRVNLLVISFWCIRRCGYSQLRRTRNFVWNTKLS